MRAAHMEQTPNRQAAGWEPIETLPQAGGRTVWLRPRDKRLLPRKWILAPGVVVPTDKFSHWRDSTEQG
jgi:hypothetical protein